jgi:hypothetical protein
VCNNGQVLRASARRWRWGKLVRERTVASCGWLAARLKMRSAANVSQTLSRTVWKSLFKSLSRTRREGKKRE